jgi:hypothetical protein
MQSVTRRKGKDLDDVGGASTTPSPIRNRFAINLDFE